MSHDTVENEMSQQIDGKFQFNFNDLFIFTLSAPAICYP